MLLQGDYYALSVVNCDRAQTEAQAANTPLTECPSACSTGVTQAGANCTAAFNVDYVQQAAAADGPAFNLSNFDVNGALALCKAPVDPAAVAAAYARGQVQFLIKSLQAASAALPTCNLELLGGADFASSAAMCAAAAAAGSCSAPCEAAITLVSCVLLFPLWACPWSWNFDGYI